MIVIKNKKTDLLEYTLRWFLDHRTIDKKGKPSITINGITHDLLMEFLYDFFNDQLKVPAQVQRSIINSAIFRWLGYKHSNKMKSEIQYFRRALSVEYDHILKNKQKFRVCIFLNIKPEEVPSEYRSVILGTEFRRITWDDFFARFGKDIINQVFIKDSKNGIFSSFSSIEHQFFDTLSFTPIEISIETYSVSGAVQIASDNHDLLRCSLNLPSVLGSYSYFRSIPEPITKIFPTPLYIISFESKPDPIIYFTIQKFKYKSNTFDTKAWDSSQKLIDNFSEESEKESCWGYLTSLLFLYQQALDLTIPSQCYLALWQVIESGLKFGSERITSDDIYNRYSKIVNLEPIHREILKILSHTRNTYVHTGIYPEDGDRILFILKIFVDSFLLALINKANKFPTIHHLREYLSLVDLNNTELERKKFAISTVDNDRNRKK